MKPEGMRPGDKATRRQRGWSPLVPLSTCLLVLFLLAGCATDYTIFGYHVGSQARKDIKTVRVPIFRNMTFYRDLEFELTQAVIKRIQDTTPYKVITDGPADALLAGTIRVGASHVAVQNELNEARSRDFALAVEVSFVDARTGQDYFLPVTQQPPLPPPPADPLQPAAPLPTPKPYTITRSANFAQELGQSLATAQQKVINDIAVQIVNMMDMPW
jgi:hypothetical protein